MFIQLNIYLIDVRLTTVILLFCCLNKCASWHFAISVNNLAHLKGIMPKFSHSGVALVLFVGSAIKSYRMWSVIKF